MGAPYMWAMDDEGANGSGPPFWFQRKVPSADKVKEQGSNCVGLINIVYGLLGLHDRFRGTEELWARYKDKAKPIVKGQEIPPMSLVIGDFVDVNCQGHVGIVLDKGKLLHCYGAIEVPTEGLFGPGICIDASWKTSHGWWAKGTYDGYVEDKDWIACL
jgi:hypothetical protein